MSYRYVECGLDYVYLEDGYAAHDTPYGKGASIERVDELHAAIGSLIVLPPAPLRGGELRFLRVEMELTQRGLADILGATEQTLRLWEKHRGKAIPGPARPTGCCARSTSNSSTARVRSAAWSIAWPSSTRGDGRSRACAKRRTAGGPKTARPRRRRSGWARWGAAT